jgi:type I restriction enzyme M protein
MARKTITSSAAQSSATIGFEAKLWLTADSLSAAETAEGNLRNNMDAAEPSGARQPAAGSPKGQRGGAEQYKAENVFWVPAEARWSHLQGAAKQPTIGKTVDDAMVAIERDNPRLKGVLPEDYARPGLDKQRLGELIDLIATIDLIASNQPSPQPSPTGRGRSEAEGEGAKHTHRSVDLLGRVYEYFLTRFASAEGKNGGQFYTPSCVDRLIVEMLAPTNGSRVYDPAFSSGPRLVMAAEFRRKHGGHATDISLFGQDAAPTARRFAFMNFALRGIEADIGPEHADTFRRDLHPDLRADFILAGPQFNDTDWFRKDDDVRWQPSGARSTAKGSPQGERGGVHQFGVPPKGNANFAWVQHFIHHLAPQGMAGFVLANGSMSSNQSGEGDIRRALIEADLVDGMVALPGQLFYSTQIPVCLWFLSRDKKARTIQHGAGQIPSHLRDRCKETLFIDARKMGTLIDRVHRELTDEDIRRIVTTYHTWRGDAAATDAWAQKKGRLISVAGYADIPGFCKSATTAEIAAHGHVLTPGRYVGAEEVEDDGDPFIQKMPRLVAELHAQFAESAKLEAAIRANLKSLNFNP